MKLIQKLKTTAALALIVAGFAVTSKAGDLVPSKGNVTGANVFAVFTANPFDAQGNPILGLTFRYTESVGSGTAIATGKFVITSRNFVEFAVVDGALVAKVVGDWIITAANGDQVFGTHEFIRPLTPPLIMTGTTITTGGNGRFEGAAGSSEFNGIVYPDAVNGLDSFEYEWDGFGRNVGHLTRNQ